MSAVTKLNLFISQNIEYRDWYGLILPIPKEFREWYIAMDYDGSVWVYETEPACGTESWWNHEPDTECSHICALGQIFPEPFFSNFTNSFYKESMSKVSEHPVVEFTHVSSD